MVYFMICGQSLQAFAFLLANASQAGSVDTGLASGVENLLATSFASGFDGTESEISTVCDRGGRERQNKRYLNPVFCHSYRDFFSLEDVLFYHTAFQPSKSYYLLLLTHQSLIHFFLSQKSFFVKCIQYKLLEVVFHCQVLNVLKSCKIACIAKIFFFFLV